MFTPSAGWELAGRCIQIEDELHGRPPCAFRGAGDALLIVAHALVPLAGASGGGVLLIGGGGIEVVRGFGIHEQSIGVKEDLHVGEADGSEGLEDFGPDVLVPLPVFGDEFGLVAKVEGLGE